LRHRIVGALKKLGDDSAKAAAQKISQNFVYAHPSIEDLASAITKLVYKDADLSSTAKALVEEMIVKYNDGFKEAIVHERSGNSSAGMVVLLTGSTGGLGSHILEILLDLDSVQRVYAFNRRGKTSVHERQRQSFIDRVLNVQLLSSDNLVYLVGDTTKPDLGLVLDVWTTVNNLNIFDFFFYNVNAASRYDHCHHPQCVDGGFQQVTILVRGPCEGDTQPH
jgi:hypothetical protein